MKRLVESFQNFLLESDGENPPTFQEYVENIFAEEQKLRPEERKVVQTPDGPAALSVYKTFKGYPFALLFNAKHPALHIIFSIEYYKRAQAEKKTLARTRHNSENPDGYPIVWMTNVKDEYVADGIFYRFISNRVNEKTWRASSFRGKHDKMPIIGQYEVDSTTLSEYLGWIFTEDILAFEYFYDFIAAPLLPLDDKTLSQCPNYRELKKFGFVKEETLDPASIPSDANPTYYKDSTLQYMKMVLPFHAVTLEDPDDAKYHDNAYEIDFLTKGAVRVKAFFAKQRDVDSRHGRPKLTLKDWDRAFGDALEHFHIDLDSSTVQYHDWTNKDQELDDRRIDHGLSRTIDDLW